MMCNCSNKITEVNIKKADPNAIIPEYKTIGSSGMDLSACIKEPITLQPFERRIIPTGLIVELPEGTEAQIRPRSGLSIKHGITLVNCIGTLDSDFRGIVGVPLINLSKEPYTIQPNERIAQMVIVQYCRAGIREVDEISETIRSDGGWGSTGK